MKTINSCSFLSTDGHSYDSLRLRLPLHKSRPELRPEGSKFNKNSDSKKFCSVMSASYSNCRSGPHTNCIETCISLQQHVRVLQCEYECNALCVLILFLLNARGGHDRPKLIRLTYSGKCVVWNTILFVDGFCLDFPLCIM